MIKLILLVSFIGLVAFGATVCLEQRKASRAVGDNATSFLAAWSERDFETAYNLMSADLRNEVDIEEFSSDLTDIHRFVVGFKAQQSSGFSFNLTLGGPSTYDYIASVTYEDGRRGEFRARFVKEQGEWLIQGFELNRDVEPSQFERSPATVPVPTASTTQ